MEEILVHWEHFGGFLLLMDRKNFHQEQEQGQGEFSGWRNQKTFRKNSETEATRVFSFLEMV